MSSSLNEKLKSAVENGDILELEQTLQEAQNLLQQGLPNAGTLRDLYLRAERLYLKFMELCKPYIKPLRRACQQLSERDIFEALLRIHSLPSNVQLHMYSDIRKAENLREDILAAQEDAVRILDCSNWRVIDKFLAESAAVLEDRTVLALVQKREDLLRNEKNKVPLLFNTSNSRTASLGRGLNTLNGEFTDQVALSNTENMFDIHNSNATALRGNSLFNNTDLNVIDGSDEPSKIRSFVVFEEGQRKALLEAELSKRKSLYKSCIVAFMSISCKLVLDVFPLPEKEYKIYDQSKKGPVFDQKGEPPLNTSKRLITTKENGEELYAQDPVSSFYGNNDKNVLSMRESRNVEKSRQPLKTPDISPIRDGFQTVNSTHLWGSASPASAIGTADNRKPFTPTAIPSTDFPRSGIFSDAKVIKLRPRESSLDTVNGSTFQDDLQKRRSEAKLKAVLQEEDIHRRDIEGTEDFDRNVFLNPLFTRLTLSMQTYMEKKARLFSY